MNRRQFINGISSGIVSLSLAGCGFKLPGSSNGSSAGVQKKDIPATTITGNIAQAQKNKVLIAYFSRTGNTREIANQIHEIIDSDLFEIKTEASYPKDYDATVDQAKREQAENFRPKLATVVPALSSYTGIFLGYPNWWQTMPMALFSFLEEYDFSDKTIIPFCTHDGGRLGRSTNDIRVLCPRATILDGLSIRGSNAKNARNDVSAWLRPIEIK